jgi:hypothetical protein
VLKNSISKSGHPHARPWGGWLRAATLMAGLAAATTAHADVDAGATIPGVQSGTVSVTAPMRSATLRQTTTKQHWISHKDCFDDIQLTFTTAVTSASASKKLVAYVSNSVDDCLQNSTRSDTTRCHHLQVITSTESSAAPQVIVKAQALTEQLGISSCGDDAEAAGMSTEPRNLKFYFFLSPPAQDLVVGGTDANFAIFEDSGVDLWGPSPPTDLVVTSGDEELQVSFSAGLNTSGDQAGYYFYVDDGSSDAGAPTTGATSGGSTSAGSSGGATTGAGSSTSTSAASSSAASSSAASSSAASSSAASSSSGAGGASASTGVGGASASSSSAATGATTASSSAATSSSTTGGGAGGAGGAGGVVGAGGTTTGVNLSTGVVGTGNTDACNPTTMVAECNPASAVLIPGAVPSNTGTGQTLTTGTNGNVTDLVNGTAYVVALAAFDDVGNLGKLSELKCGTPTPVDSFLRVYRCKNGFADSGCGFCSVSADRGSSFAALVSGGLVVFGLIARRSRRRRVSGSSRGAR